MAWHLCSIIFLGLAILGYRPLRTYLFWKFQAPLGETPVNCWGLTPLEHVAKQPLRNLTADEISEYRRRGYVLIKNAIPMEYVKSLQAYQHLIPESLSDTHHHFSTHSCIRYLLWDSPGLPLLAQATQARHIGYGRDRIFQKQPQLGASAGAKRAMSFHQDISFPITPTAAGVSLGFPLTDITLEAGCTEFADTKSWPTADRKTFMQINAQGWSEGAESSIENKTYRLDQLCGDRGDVLIFDFEAVHRAGGPCLKHRALWAIRLTTDLGNIGRETELWRRAAIWEWSQIKRWWGNTLEASAYETAAGSSEGQSIQGSQLATLWSDGVIPEQERHWPEVQLGARAVVTTLAYAARNLWRDYVL